MTDLLQNADTEKPMTHTDVVRFASAYLANRCKVVLPEFYSHNSELPDVIGFNSGAVIDDGHYEHREYSLLVEVKVSRSDFMKDRKKSFRIRPEEGMGDFRYYCCPKGLIKPEEVPEGWGVLYVYPSGQVRSVKGSRIHPKDVTREFHLLYYYARRANFAGVHGAIVAYRGYDT